MDHDQRFKTLIQVFFSEFLLLFFASWAARLHSATVEWLDKEVFPDPPEGPRRALDMVGKVATREAVPRKPAGDPGQFLALEPYQGVRAMNTTWYEKGMEQGTEKGIEKGIEKERRETVREQLEDRFGELPPQAQERLQELSMDELKSLRKALLHAASLKELGLVS